MNTNLRTTKRQVIRHFSIVWLLLPTANCLLPIFSCEAQSDVLKYARQVVDTLASPSMHGRGYVNKGDSIAADFLKNQFKTLKLSSFNGFYQKFFLSVNSYPGNTTVEVDGNKLLPGKDYLILNARKENNGIYKIAFLDSSIYQKKIKSRQINSKALIVPELGNTGNTEDIASIIYWNKPKYSPAIVCELQNKLTWSVPKYNTRHALLQLKDSSIYCTAKTLSIITDGCVSIPNYQSQNVIGYILGTQYPDSFIVFSAHYDHLGRMGKDVYFPGANDNASGCAMLLNLAKYYSEHPPKYSIAFMAFGAEEVGLLGSKYYVEHPLFPLKQIKFLVNMDIMGTGDEGIKVVNATEHKKEFDELVKINSEKNLLPLVSPRGKAANSDHYFFSEAGVKTFFIYTLGGIKAYHDIYDRPETLPLTKFEQVYNLLLQFTDYLQK